MTVKTLTERLLANWPAKIVCLALALLLFMFYRMSTLQERFFSVPLEVETNGDIVPASAFPRMVKIGLRGDNESIYPIIDSDVVAVLDLTRFTKEGEYRVAIQTKLKGTAVDVSPLEVSVDPVEVNLRVEHRVVKKLSVTPSFKGYPEAGFEFSGYALNPTTVEISGPRSAVEKLNDLATEQIELSGRNASFNGTVSVLNASPLISASGGGKIEYSVTINQKTLVRNFGAVPFYFENLDPSLSVETDVPSGDLQLKGSESDLAELALPENSLTVLCENVTEPGVYSLPVQVIVPERFEVLSSSPGQVQLTVRRKAP